jgi:hypothetical protein
MFNSVGCQGTIATITKSSINWGDLREMEYTLTGDNRAMSSIIICIPCLSLLEKSNQERCEGQCTPRNEECIYIFGPEISTEKSI